MWEDMGAIETKYLGILFFSFSRQKYAGTREDMGAIDVGGHGGHRDKISRDIVFFIFMTKVCRDLGRTWGHRLGGHGGHRSRGTAAKSGPPTPITEE